MSNVPEVLVTHPRELEGCCREIASAETIAFDTEFVGEDSYRPDLCLLQVATPQALYVIDPLATGNLSAFWQLIVDPKRTVVVHAGREEIRMCQFECGKPPANIVDVQIAAGLVGFSFPIGYAQLLQQLLGIRLTKGETLTDWRRRPLSAQQLTYAFDDVRHLLPLWDSLRAKLAALGRFDWAKEEFDTLVERAIRDNPADEKWRKLRGIGSLDRRKLAIVREVFQWRDEKAARLNRPPRYLLRDDLIVEVARRCPRNEKELTALRGLAKGDSAGILAAVERACALPYDQHPEESERDFDPPQVGLVTSLLAVVLADYCQRQQLAVSLAATTGELRALVRSRLEGGQLPASSTLSRGWRKHCVLPELVGLLDGAWALSVANVKVASPFARVSLQVRPRSESS